MIQWEYILDCVCDLHYSISCQAYMIIDSYVSVYGFMFV